MAEIDESSKFVSRRFQVKRTAQAVWKTEHFALQVKLKAFLRGWFEEAAALLFVDLE